MQFHGMTYGYLLSIGIICAGVLIASHFMTVFARRKMVPTVLFWQDVQLPVQRNRIWGRFSSLATLLFLLITMSSFLFLLSNPSWPGSSYNIIILDRSPVTDLEQAKSMAASIIEDSDFVSLLVVDENVLTLSRFDEPKSCSLTNLESLNQSNKWYSAIDLALEEASRLNQKTHLYVISGQNMQVGDYATLLPCPDKAKNVEITPFKVACTDDMADYVRYYCQTDGLYDYVNTVQEADIVVSKIHSDPRYCSYVHTLSNVLTDKVGLTNRRLLDKQQHAQTAGYDHSIVINYLDWLGLIVAILLMIDMILYKKGRIV